MNILDLDTDATIGAVIDELHTRPVLVQLPQVYALLAPATPAGAAGLNRMKARLPGKSYGTAVGRMQSFWDMIDSTSLPESIQDPAVLDAVPDVFYRCKIAEAETETAAVRQGTHQTLVLGGRLRELMRSVEKAFESQAEPEMFGGHHFSAPLITSCNVSGDPLGSITDEVRAREFIDQRGVGLWVRGAGTSCEQGSFPILELNPAGIGIGRKGPGLDCILESIYSKSRA
ncbi:MAG TPA: hypothetical protein EYQ74_01745 [Planctomycetes bacterium]|nr:hypothetical protein [Planctomycetota bacterium]HIK62274.1 hypothetical protein [Planctomycetota bacterium]